MNKKTKQVLVLFALVELFLLTIGIIEWVANL